MASPLKELRSRRSQLEVMLKCPVCQDIFNDPHQLPCGHSFCMHCLKRMAEICPEIGQMFACPDCRAYFGQQVPVQKCYTLTNIVDDLRAIFQTKPDAVVFCDLCHMEGGSKQAVKTCLKCEVSLCDGHVRPHRERPAYREHPLIKPRGDLVQMKCPEHKELTYYCPTSKTYVCQVCTMERKHFDHITKPYNLLGEKLKENMENHFLSLEGQLQDCKGTVRKLKEDIQYNYKPTQASSCLNRAIAALLLLWFIACFCAHHFSVENQTLSGTVQNQQIKLHNLFVLISDTCFQPPQEPLQEPARRTQHGLNRMDVDSANPLLKVSYDLMSVERVTSKQSLPEHPSRFDKAPQVLTTQCFSSGRHYWEVEAEGYWDIAVSYRSINRKLKDLFGYNKESWSLTHDDKGNLFASHNRREREISTSMRHSRVAVEVDFQQDTITFYEVGVTLTQLHEFSARLSKPVCLGFGLYRTDPPSRVSIVKTL